MDYSADSIAKSCLVFQLSMQLCSLQHAAVSKNSIYEHAEFSISNTHDLEEKTSKYEIRKSSQIDTKEMGRQNRERDRSLV